MNATRKALIILIAILIAVLGTIYVWQLLPSAPLVAAIGALVTGAVVALAVRIYRGLT